MSRILTVLAAGLMTCVTVISAADDPKKSKTVEELYPNMKGIWESANRKAILTLFQLAKYDKPPADFPTPWHIGLVFTSGDGKG